MDPLLSPEAARVAITLRMCEEGVLEAFVEDVIEGLRYLSENPTKTTKTSAFYHMLQTVCLLLSPYLKQAKCALT